MTKETIKTLVISASVASVFSIIVLGSILFWTESYISRVYFDAYRKYDSIQTGMMPEQVQEIMKVTPGERPASEFEYDKSFDKVMVYPIALGGEGAHFVAVFYMQGKVIGRQAYANEVLIFTEKIEEGGRLPIGLVAWMMTGVAAAVAWIILFPRYSRFRQNSPKKFWIDVLLGICFVIVVSLVTFLQSAYSLVLQIFCLSFGRRV